MCHVLYLYLYISKSIDIESNSNRKLVNRNWIMKFASKPSSSSNYSHVFIYLIIQTEVIKPRQNTLQLVLMYQTMVFQWMCSIVNVCKGADEGLVALTCACTAEVVPPVLEGRTLDVLLSTFFCCKAMLYLQAAFLYSLSWKMASAWYTSSWYFWDGENSSLKKSHTLLWSWVHLLKLTQIAIMRFCEKLTTTGVLN